MNKKLFIPGPVDVSEDVLLKLSEPVIGHRTKEFGELLISTINKLKRLMFTENNVFISTSSSTGLMEAAIRNCVKEKCLNIANGAFGERWHEITLINGKKADLLKIDWGLGVKPKIVEEKLSSNEYDAVTLVHNETSTGVTNPIYEIAKIIKKYPNVCFLVDTVSSLGGIKIEVDKLGIDVCLAGVQKALAVPPGLAVCSVSEKALEKSKTINNKGYYFNFQIFLKYLEKNQTPTTPSISLLKALNYQLEKILNEEGLENRFKRHETLGEITREWAKKNFELFAEEKYASNTLTCIKNTKNINLNELETKLYEKGYIFSNGYGKIKDLTFRIAHMGDLKIEELKRYLETINKILGF